MTKLEAGFHKNAISYLLVLRLIPALPFWVVNIVPALFGMRLNHYVLATFIGITPGTLIYVWVARSFDSLLSGGQSPDLSVLSEPAITAPLFALGLLSLFPALWKRSRAHKRMPTSDVTHEDTHIRINNDWKNLFWFLLWWRFSRASYCSWSCVGEGWSWPACCCQPKLSGNQHLKFFM